MVMSWRIIHRSLTNTFKSNTSSQLLSSSSSLYNKLKSTAALILQHDALYYNLSPSTTTNKPIEDFEYDELVLEERRLCELHPDLLSKLEADHPLGKSATRYGGRVGVPTTISSTSTSTSTSSKVPHLENWGMLSLDNLPASPNSPLTSITDWLEKKLATAEPHLADNAQSQFAIWAEPKIDGLSLSVRYERDSQSQSATYNLVNAATRGDGVTGESVKFACQNGVRNVPSRISVPVKSTANLPDVFEVRGEVVLPRCEFDLLAATNAASNPRNAAAGILRRKIEQNNNETKDLWSKLVFYAYETVPYGFVGDSYSEVREMLSGCGFQATEPALMVDVGGGGAALASESLLNYYENSIGGSNRDKLSFEVDGVVYKFDSLPLRNIIGSNSRSPKWAVAHKYAAAMGTTKLLGIESQVGRTGAITPVAIFEEVVVGGVKIKKASLHNYKEASRLLGGGGGVGPKEIAYGTRVVVKRAGDVIPQIVGVCETEIGTPTDTNSHKTTIEVSPPNFCPACGSATVVDEGEQVLRCAASPPSKCPPQALRSLAHAVSRTALDIDGLSLARLTQLKEAGLVQTCSDLMRLDEEENVALVTALPGWGEKSAENLVNSIRKKKKKENEHDGVELYRVIYCLGVRHVGVGGSKIIGDLLEGSEARFIEAVEKNNWGVLLLECKGVGSVIVDSLTNYCNDPDNVAEVKKLCTLLSVKEHDGKRKFRGSRNSENAPFTGKTVVFTGTLPNGLSRDRAREMAKDAGASGTPNSVSANTGILVAGDNGGGKEAKARGLNILVLTGEEFLTKCVEGGIKLENYN